MMLVVFPISVEEPATVIDLNHVGLGVLKQASLKQQLEISPTMAVRAGVGVTPEYRVRRIDMRPTVCRKVT